MKTYAPKDLHGACLADLLHDLPATPAQAAKFLRVSERTVWRWLKDENAPFAVLAALWHETPEGRHHTHLDVRNELAIYYGMAKGYEKTHHEEQARIGRLIRIGDFGSANDPLMNGHYQTAKPFTASRIPSIPDLMTDPENVDFG